MLNPHCLLCLVVMTITMTTARMMMMMMVTMTRTTRMMMMMLMMIMVMMMIMISESWPSWDGAGLQQHRWEPDQPPSSLQTAAEFKIGHSPRKPTSC